MKKRKPITTNRKQKTKKSEKILIATTNPGKFSELKRYLEDLPFEFVSLNDLKILKTPNESGKDFSENAKIKAEFYSQKSKLPTITDDGGLEIFALGGEPGVNSHRWLKGKEATDEELINYTLNKMRPFKGEQRKAQLRVVIALIMPGGQTITSEAAIPGLIAEKPSEQRIRGYPYRSLLFLPEFKKYYDELTKEEHEKINHRKKALEKIKQYLNINPKF